MKYDTALQDLQRTRIRLFRDVMSRLIPLDSLYLKDPKFGSKQIERISKIIEGNADENFVESFLYWIEFYRTYFKGRKFIYAQSFLNTTFVTRLFEDLKILYGYTLWHQGKKSREIKLEPLPIQLLNDEIFMYYPMNKNEWFPSDKKIFDEMIKWVKKGEFKEDKLTKQFWNSIEKKYTNALKEVREKYGRKINNIFELIEYKKSLGGASTNDSDLEYLVEFIYVSFFDLYEFCRSRNKMPHFLNHLISNIINVKEDIILCSDTNMHMEVIKEIQELHPLCSDFCAMPVTTTNLNIVDKSEWDFREDLGWSIIFFKGYPTDSSERKFINQSLRALNSIISGTSFTNTALLTRDEQKAKAKKIANRNAVTAIMSRNESHNIGSHVLSRIATSSDIKDKEAFPFLARYIQQRMDFFATVATEWPDWTFPAYLSSDIMRGFLSQEILLKYIAESENLTAYYFLDAINSENTSTPLESNCSIDEKNRMRFHLLKIPQIKWDEKHNNIDDHISDLSELIIISTPLKSKSFCDVPVIKYENDVVIDIPGGIVGYHSFYTIIENIIRNSAKHDYAFKKKDEAFKHLDIIIEIQESLSHDASLKIWNFGNGSSPVKLMRIYTNVKPSIPIDSLINKINKYLINPIINEEYQQTNENWGIYEILISAAFLQMRSINHIGVGQEYITGERNMSMFNQAKSSKGSMAIIQAVESPLGTLAYEFFVLEPREIGIVKFHKLLLPNMY